MPCQCWYSGRVSVEVVAGDRSSGASHQERVSVDGTRHRSPISRTVTASSSAAVQPTATTRDDHDDHDERGAVDSKTAWVRQDHQEIPLAIGKAL